MPRGGHSRVQRYSIYSLYWYFTGTKVKILTQKALLGSVYNKNGLDIEALKKHYTEKGMLLGFAGAERELAADTAHEMLEEVRLIYAMLAGPKISNFRY